jgi:hypothetical protein
VAEILIGRHVPHLATTSVGSLIQQPPVRAILEKNGTNWWPCNLVRPQSGM